MLHHTRSHTKATPEEVTWLAPGGSCCWADPERRKKKKKNQSINERHTWLHCTLTTPFLQYVGSDTGEQFKKECPTWSRLDRLLGSWLRPWYWPLSLSPAAIFLNFFRSTTYRALRSTKKKKKSCHIYLHSTIQIASKQLWSNKQGT